MRTHQSNLSFEQLKLDLELENWLKIEKNQNCCYHFREPKSQNFFVWKQAALK